MPSYVKSSNSDAYVVKCFALVKCILLRHSSQIRGEMSDDLLPNRKHLYEISEIICLRQNAINAVWRLTLRRMLTQSLELNFLGENIAFVVDNKYTQHICGQLLIGHN